MIDDDHQRALARLMDGPFVSALKLKLDATTEGAATVRLPYGPTILNAGEADVVIHGGAIAALIDTAACAAVWTMPETRNSATVSMSVNYTAPGIRSDLIADAKVRRKGRRLASVAVEVSDNAGALIADALVTYKIA